jgi:flagellar biosynthetic protein FliQ
LEFNDWFTGQKFRLGTGNGYRTSGIGENKLLRNAIRLCPFQSATRIPQSKIERSDMTPEFLAGFFFEAIKTSILLAAPMLLAGLIVGLLVSIFQSATSINEMTLTFIPKMLAVACALLFFLPWMMQKMLTFTTNLFSNIVTYIR